MSQLRRELGLVILLITFLVLGVIYISATPPLETPDAPSHLAVVKYIADHWRLPPANPAPADAGPVPTISPGPPVYYAPPLYYILGATLIADLDTDGFVDGVVPNPNWARGWAPTLGRAPENKNAYVLTVDQRPPLAGWGVAMQRLRLFSLVLGALTVAGIFALTKQLTDQPDRQPKKFTNLATTAFVAFNPAFLFITTGVTNDALLIALSTWAFVLMVRMVNFKFQISRVMLLGLVLGLAALTKQSALVLMPVAALAVLWGAGSRRRALEGLVLLAVLTTLISGWWYANNALAYGDPLGFAPHHPPTDDWSPPLSLMLRQLGQALQSYWAVFGWGLVQVEPVVYILVAAFVLVGLAGWLYDQVRAREQTPQTTRRVFVVLGAGISFNLLGLLVWLWRTSAPYGRLLYPIIGPLAVLVLIGWQRSVATTSVSPFRLDCHGQHRAVCPGRPIPLPAPGLCQPCRPSCCIVRRHVVGHAI